MTIKTIVNTSLCILNEWTSLPAAIYENSKKHRFLILKTGICFHESYAGHLWGYCASVKKCLCFRKWIEDKASRLPIISFLWICRFSFIQCSCSHGYQDWYTPSYYISSSVWYGITCFVSAYVDPYSPAHGSFRSSLYVNQGLGHANSLFSFLFLHRQGICIRDKWSPCRFSGALPILKAQHIVGQLMECSSQWQEQISRDVFSTPWQLLGVRFNCFSSLRGL